MLFSEVYGSYYNVVAAVLAAATGGELTEARLYAIVREKAFAESVLNIPAALKTDDWPLLTPELATPLHHAPTMPLTTLQKRWLKALLSDPRIRLFAPPAEGLEEVEPLYPADAFVYFDRYSDGDPFADEQYIARFQTILTALREKRKLRICFKGHRGKRHSRICVPHKLEYSAKDDKFRLLASSPQSTLTINLARIGSCELLEEYSPQECRPKPPKKKTLVLELTDERNALERAMLHFSHLEKETERLDESRYRITLRYEEDDETELLIRVLSFGPMLRAVSPDSFIKQIKKRLNKQQELRAQN